MGSGQRNAETSTRSHNLSQHLYSEPTLCKSHKAATSCSCQNFFLEKNTQSEKVIPNDKNKPSRIGCLPEATPPHHPPGLQYQVQVQRGTETNFEIVSEKLRSIEDPEA